MGTKFYIMLLLVIIAEIQPDPQVRFMIESIAAGIGITVVLDGIKKRLQRDGRN